jgi:hypothetical protein
MRKSTKASTIVSQQRIEDEQVNLNIWIKKAIIFSLNFEYLARKENKPKKGFIE